MKFVFIYGLPATGKLTVAQELAALTGYKLFHNHLVVDLLLSVFEFGSEPFVSLREEMWLSVFKAASATDLPGLIFTFNPESSVRGEFVDNVIETVTTTGGEVDFVELVSPMEELKRRIDNASRHQFHKLTSISLFEKLHAERVFETGHMPKPRISIDTSTHSPSQAAEQIIQQLKLPRLQAAAVHP